LTPNLTAFTGVDSQNLPDVMVSVQFILAIGDCFLSEIFYIYGKNPRLQFDSLLHIHQHLLRLNVIQYNSHRKF
ncbi:hypothetical protein, partial [Lactobacillus delbrueckii]|uniref:hypothetical protein n=1 Tax=Lactobacillus delbrueckii TaxID=1584 RepID=UPI0021A81F43